MKLTRQQLLAANKTDGPFLVLAIPGSGKTTMLLERIKNLPVKKDKILSLTFSRIQARDMKERFKTKTNNFMTIHAFCYLIIRNYLKKFNKSVRLIEDEKIYNKYNLVGEIYKKINKSSMSKEDLDLFFREISFMKNSLKDLSYRSKVEIKNIQTIYKYYEAIKRKNHLLDFDDMQVYAYKILDDKNLLRSIKNKYKYFQLDEGQDTSLLQFKILERIVYPENNLMIVADDDQSIYSFRAAEPSYLLNFRKHFKNGEILKLDINHRSGENIVNFSKDFISKNKNRYEKIFKASRKSVDKIVLKNFKNSKKEFSFIGENLKDNEKTAILYRNNISAISLISYLLKEDIDFNIDSKVLDFFQSRIFKDLISIIKFSKDFSNTEIFEDIYYKIGTFLKKDQLKLLTHKPVNENIFDFYQEADIKDFQKDSLFNIEKKLKHIRKLSLDKKISFIYNNLSYKSYIKMISRKNNEETVNKDIYIESAINFTKDLETLDELREKISFLEKKSKSLIRSNLYLSTIHSSKGLEYDTVFLIDLVKNEFPIIFSDDDRFEKLEEERRIFYVAITRAKNSLYILSLKRRNNKKVKPSIFYEEASHILK